MPLRQINISRENRVSYPYTNSHNCTMSNKNLTISSFRQAERIPGREMAGGFSRDNTVTSERSPTALIPSTPRIAAVENPTNNTFENLNAANRQNPNSNLIHNRHMTNNSSTDYPFTNDQPASHHISPRDDRSVAHTNYSELSSNQMPLQDRMVPKVTPMHDRINPARIPANVQNDPRYVNTDKFNPVYSSQNNQNVDLENQNGGNEKNPSFTLERIVRNQPNVENLIQNYNHQNSANLNIAGNDRNHITLREYRHQSKKGQICDTELRQAENMTDPVQVRGVGRSNVLLSDAGVTDLEQVSPRMQEQFKNVQLADSTRSSPEKPPANQTEDPIEGKEKANPAAGPYCNDATKKANFPVRTRRIKYTPLRRDFKNGAINNSREDIKLITAHCKGLFYNYLANKVYKNFPEIEDKAKFENNPTVSVIRCNPQNGPKTAESKSNSADGHHAERADTSNPTGAIAQVNSLPDKDSSTPVSFMLNITKQLIENQNLEEFYDLVEYFKSNGVCYNDDFTLQILSDINNQLSTVGQTTPEDPVSKENDPPETHAQSQNHESCKEAQSNTVECPPAKSNMDLQLESNQITKKEGVHSLPLGVLNSNLITQRKPDKLSNLIKNLDVFPNAMTSIVPKIIEKIFDPSITSYMSEQDNANSADVNQNSIAPKNCEEIDLSEQIIDLTYDETSSTSINESPDTLDIKIDTKLDNNVTSKTVMKATSFVRLKENGKKKINTSISTQTTESRVEDSVVSASEQLLTIDLTDDEIIVIASRKAEYVDNKNDVLLVSSDNSCQTIEANDVKVILPKVENVSIGKKSNVEIENCTEISDDIAENDDKNILLNVLPPMSDNITESKETSTQVDDRTIEMPKETMTCETNNLRSEEVRAASNETKKISTNAELTLTIDSENSESILQNTGKSDSLTNTKAGMILETLQNGCDEAINDSEINTEQAEYVQNSDLNNKKIDKTTQFCNVCKQKMDGSLFDEYKMKYQTECQTETPIKCEISNESDSTSHNNLKNKETHPDLMEFDLKKELECTTEGVSKINPDSNIPEIEREVEPEREVVSNQIVRSDDAITDRPDETPPEIVANNTTMMEQFEKNHESCEIPHAPIEYKNLNSLKTYTNKKNRKISDESNHNDPKSKKVKIRSESLNTQKHNRKGSVSKNTNMKVIEVGNKFILKSVKNFSDANPINESEIIQTTDDNNTNNIGSVNETQMINESKADKAATDPILTYVRQSKTENEPDLSNITYMNKDSAATTIDPNPVIIQNSFVTISYGSPVILHSLNGYYYEMPPKEWDQEVPIESSNSTVDSNKKCARDDWSVLQHFESKISNNVNEKSSPSETCLALPSNNEPNSHMELDDMTGVMKEMQQMLNSGVNSVESNCDDAPKIDNAIAGSRAENIESASKQSPESPTDFEIFKKSHKRKDSGLMRIDKEQKHESLKKKPKKKLKKSPDSIQKKLNKISKKHKESKLECQNDIVAVGIKRKRGRPRKTSHDCNISPKTNPNQEKTSKHIDEEKISKPVKPLKKDKSKKKFLDRTLSDLFKPEAVIVYDQTKLKNGETFNSLLPKNVEEHPKSLKRKKEHPSESVKPIAEKHKHVESDLTSRRKSEDVTSSKDLTPRRKSEDVTSSKQRKVEEPLASLISEKPKIQTSISKNDEAESNLDLIKKKLLSFHLKYNIGNDQCSANKAPVTLSGKFFDNNKKQLGTSFVTERVQTVKDNSLGNNGISLVESVNGKYDVCRKKSSDPKDLVVVQCGDRLFTVKKCSVNISQHEKKIAEEALKLLYM